MRFFTVDYTTSGHPFIRAEIAVTDAEAEAMGGPEGTDAVALSGPAGDVMTRQLLLATSEGRNALTAWGAGDDAQYEALQREELRSARIEDVRMLAMEGDPAAQRLERLGFPDAELREFVRSTRGERHLQVVEDDSS